jgi:hypothetical protein
MTDAPPVDSGISQKELGASFQRWDDVSGRSTRVIVDEFIRHRPYDGWMTDDEAAPPPPVLGEEGVMPMGFVDLHVLKPGTLVHFFGSHNAANYVLRILDSNTIKLWRIAWYNQVGGVVGLADAIKIWDKSSRNEESDEADLYTGALVKRGFKGIEPTITMPYFEYDKNGKIKKPTGEWFDTVMGIYIKEPEE